MTGASTNKSSASATLRKSKLGKSSSLSLASAKVDKLLPTNKTALPSKLTLKNFLRLISTTPPNYKRLHQLVLPVNYDEKIKDNSTKV
jgi:hypothetical protein